MARLPNHQTALVELTALFVEELRLCKVQPGETVVAYTDAGFDPVYAEACTVAARMLGAETFKIVSPTARGPLPRGPMLEAWKAADMVVGMSTTSWLYSDAHNEALASGTRTLMVMEPIDVLTRLFPTEDVRRRAEAGAKYLEAGSTIRITSPAGTDLTMSKAGRRGAAQFGIADVPGRWDHWPSGFVACAPIEDSANGVLVLDRMDSPFKLGRYIESPVTLNIEGGRIVSFEGGTDAMLLEEFFRASGEHEAYGLSHIGWGAHPKARWNAMNIAFPVTGAGVMDLESYYGNMLIAFGSNFVSTLGGERRCGFHIDIPCLRNSFFVDGVEVVREGEIVIDELK
jgi:2,5-dihydroxypyridine 5,6-dioxygenase